MQTCSEKMTPKKAKAIAALITCRTSGEAAAAAGICEATLWRWFQKKDFRGAYREVRIQAVRQAIGQVQSAFAEAVETLRAIMADTGATSSSRVSAAKTVLEMAPEGVELEALETRIAALEDRLKRKATGTTDFLKGHSA
jgi:AcrR family transcriptional regulator